MNHQTIKLWSKVRKSKETGDFFMGVPERWWDDSTYVCQNGHVSTSYLKSELSGNVCFECQEIVWMAPPELTEDMVKKEFRVIRNQLRNDKLNRING